MPTLRKYVPSSPKRGYYIQANVGGGAPITLQVSKLAQRILKENNYSDTGTVPTKLVWAMYDVGLLSTGNSTDTGGKTADVYSAFTSSGVSARLREPTRQKLVDYLDDYDGQQRRRVNRLQRKLSNSGDNNSNRGQTSTRSSTTKPTRDKGRSQSDVPPWRSPGRASKANDSFSQSIAEKISQLWDQLLSRFNVGKGDDTQAKTRPSDRVPQAEAAGQVVNLTIEARGGTQDTLAQYKNHQVHIDGGTPGKTVQVELSSGQGFLIGRIVGSED